ncbi:MAG TPA: hypothetical protein VMQ17_25080 [Candidatus Sulfotelmatobacter sp.]|nr:hypothetical protein [Candidatus Sulfotelmatobacter sp.]
MGQEQHRIFAWEITNNGPMTFNSPSGTNVVLDVTLKGSGMPQRRG